MTLAAGLGRVMTTVVLLGGAGAVGGSAGQPTSLVAIVPNSDAPADVIQADIVPLAIGHGEAVRVIIRNFSQESIDEVGLETLFYDADNHLRHVVNYPARLVGESPLTRWRRGPLSVGGSVAVDLPIVDTEIATQCKVAVAVTQVRLASRLWSANPADVRREALEVVSMLNR